MGLKLLHTGFGTVLGRRVDVTSFLWEEVHAGMCVLHKALLDGPCTGITGSTGTFWMPVEVTCSLYVKKTVKLLYRLQNWTFPSRPRGTPGGQQWTTETQDSLQSSKWQCCFSFRELL